MYKRPEALLGFKVPNAEGHPTWPVRGAKRILKG
jgi:hypothetical protein